MMKLVVCAQGPGLDAPVDPRFGRCECFVVVDSDTEEWQSHPNPARGSAGGAGVRAAQMVVDLGADAVVTGNIGPNALQILQAAGVKVYAARQGTVSDIVRQWRDNQLPPDDATVPPHSGGGLGWQRGKGGRMQGRDS